MVDAKVDGFWAARHRAAGRVDNAQPCAAPTPSRPGPWRDPPTVTPASCRSEMQRLRSNYPTVKSADAVGIVPWVSFRIRV